MRIGILALQGAFAEHEAVLHKLNTDTFEIRKYQDWQQPCDGLIIPGGESTVMNKLLHTLGLFTPIQKAIMNGLPVFGTCAGMILLAKEVHNGTPCLATMDITVQRNAYGRQSGSFTASENFHGLGKLPMTFIRAPYIEQTGKNVEILAAVDGKIVAARQQNQLVTAFHPEIDMETAVHKYFLNIVQEYLQNKQA